MDNSLVLVIMDKFCLVSIMLVLILVVMDNSLVQYLKSMNVENALCLNPCCNGQQSSTEGNLYVAATLEKS